MLGRHKDAEDAADELIYDALDPNPESRIPCSRDFLAGVEKLPDVPSPDIRG